MSNQQKRPQPLSLMGRWRQLPIRWKVLLVVLLPIILVSVLLNATVLGGNPLQGSISRSAESNLLTRGSQLANGISERLTIVQVALRGSTQSNAVTAYAEAHLSGDASRVEAARPALDDYLRNAVSLGEVALVELRVVNSKGDPASVIRRDASGTPQVLANLRPGADAANALFTEALAAPLGFGLARTSLQTDFASDSKQQEATLELALPIKVREQAAGVIIGRLSVRELLTPLLTFEGNDPFQVRFSVLTTEGQLLITTDPQAATAEGRITWWGSPNLSTLPLSLPEVAEVLRSQQLNTFSQQVFRAYPLAVTEGTISNLDWALIASKPVIDSIAADAINERNRQAVFAVFGLLALAGLIFFVGQQLTRPLVEVSNFAQRVAAGDFNARMNVESTDEVGQVATTLNAMSARVSDLVRTLEQDVNVRKRNLEIAAEIGRDAVQLRDINDLLQRTVNAIRDRFAFYHAQVFLVDEANEYAVLVTSTGEIGQQMLARRHKLAVGSDSIVGQVTAQGRTFVTLDTARSEVPHRFNPLLPRTRSEMALPLRSGDSVIGALDIQSVEPSAFNDEDVRIFQVLADQLASAITNARLFADSQERLDQINELNRQLTARSWDEFVTTQSAKELAFEYDLMNVTPTEALLSSKADGNGSESVTEITVRGEVVGEVAIPHLSNAPLTQEDQLVIRAVADRVALAIENARLVERTQGALSEVERLYYATRALSGAATMDDVYRILKDQVTAQAFVDSVVILAARPVQSPDAPAFETAYLWSRDEKAALGMFEPRRKFASDLIPQQWRKPEQAANQASLIANLETDLVEYDVLRQTYRTFGVRSVLVTALRTGERWFGLLLVQSRRPRVFLEAFRKFVTTLADQVATALENRVLFQAAEDERQTLESVLNSLPTGVIVVDEDATTSISNEQARQLLGLDENEPFERFRTATGSQYLEDDFPPNFALRTGEPVVAEDMTVVNADGFRTDLLVNAVPVFNNEGRVISAVAVFQDVTELRELESVLQESLRETTTLYEASRAIANEADLTGVMDVLLTQTQNAIHASALYLIFNNSQNEITQVYRGAVKEDQNEVVVLDGIGVPVPRWALTDEQVVEIDVNANPEAANAPELKAEGILAFYVFPLLARARTVGWLVAAFDTPQDLSSEDRRFINTIADQTAVAAEGIRLSQETQQALSETTLLYEASYAINRADTILGAVEIMRDQVQYFGPTQIDIFLVSDGRDGFRTDWVVHWDVSDPEATGEVTLDGATTFNHTLLIDAEPYYVENVVESSPTRVTQLKATPGWGRFRAQASLPLTVKGRVTGRLLVSYDKPHRFGRLERQFLTALVAQASVVIDNVTLVQQTQASLEETATLYQSSRQIADAANMYEVLQALIDHTAPPSVVRAMAFRLTTERWNDSQASVLIRASWSVEDEAPPPDSVQAYGPDDFPLWSIIARDETLWLDSLDLHDPKFVETFGASAVEYLSALNAVSVVSLPLRASGRVIGTLLFVSTASWAQTSRDFRLYASVADQVAATLQGRYLLEQTETRARQLATSAQVSRAAASLLELSDLFNTSVNLIKDSFGYDHAQIFLVNEAGDDAVLVASTGEAGRQLLAIKHHLPVGSQSIIGRVTSTGEPTLVVDTQDKRDVHRPNPYLPLTRSEMALPLIARQRIIGALDVQSNQPGQFTREDIEALSVLADQIAVAIDNARLFDISSRRADEMRFLFDATRAATAAMSDESGNALERIAQLVLSNLRATGAMVLLLDPTRTKLIAYNELAIDSPLTLNYTYDVNSSVFKLVLDSKQPAIINDVVQVSRQALPGLRDVLPGVGSAVFVPMLAGDNILGMVGALKVERYGFTDDAQRLLLTLTSSMAAIIQNIQLLQEVQAANTRLRELDALKSQFLANMSHELRTPLNSIIGFSRVILKGIDGPLTEFQAQDLTTIHESGKHLLGLVNDILDQAKIEAGKMELQSSTFSIIDLIKGVTSTAHGLLKDKPIRLRQEVDPTVSTAWGDEFRTRQVLLNLVSNAAKFTAQGAITLSAFPVDQNGREMVQISVTDTGIGIPADKLEAVFEAFQQVENSTARQYEGTGLGLPIARKLVELQGGKIWVNSELNVGSTFSFTVPLQPTAEELAASAEAAGGEEPMPTTYVEAAPESAPTAPPPVSEVKLDTQILSQVTEVIQASETPRPQKIILAIDDEVGMINLYRRYLMKSGYEVISSQAEEAEELAINYQPRLILLDINMPNRSGWEVLRSLKDRDETFAIPVIVCSIEANREQAFRLGAADYLMKSIDERTLVDAVKRIEATRDRRKVLIIDDQQDSIRLIKESLSVDERFVIYEATSGAEGLEMVTSQWPDVILLDLRMPDMDGFAVQAQLRADPATAAIPIVILTADDLTHDELQQLDGLAVYLKGMTKPDELIAYVVSQLAW